MRYVPFFIVVFFLTQCSTPTQPVVDPLGFIPAKPLAILHTEDMESVMRFSKNQPELSSFLKPLLSLDEHWLPFQESTISFHEEGVKDYKYLLIHPLTPLDSVPQLIGDTLRYENLPIVQFEKQKTNRYALVHNDYYFESDSRILIENSIRLHNVPNTPDDNLKKLYDSKSGIFQLYVHERLQGLLNEKFNNKAPFSISDFSPWVAIQPKTEKGNIVLETTGLFSSDQLTKMSLLADHTNRLSKVLSNLPITVAGAEIYSFDYESFNRNSDRYNAQQNLPNHPLDSLLIKANAIATIYTSKNQIAVLDITDFEEVFPILEKNSEATQKVRDAVTYQFAENTVLNKLGAPLLNLPALSHASALNDMLFLAPNQASLAEVITQITNGFTLGSDEQFDSLLDEIPNECSMLFVGVEELFSKQLNTQLIDDIRIASNDEFPYWLGIGLVESGVAQIQFKGVSKQEKITNKRPKLLFSTAVESPIANGPTAVLNHLNGSMEWVIQDEKNNLKLISNAGRNTWTRPIDGPIQFPIHQVDLYKNSRLQMAYTTKNSFEVIDRNAKPVQPFSSKLNNPLPLAVFDYENTRDYRLVIVNQNTLELRDRKFQKVSGFNRTKANLKYAPKHLRIGTRDYIAMVENSGKLLLLNRRGNVRIKTPNDLILSSDVYLHQNGFVGLDDKNRLFRIEINGTISYRTLPFETLYKIHARGKNIVLLTENKLEINGRLLELDFGLYGDPLIHVVNNRTLISLHDQQEEKVYVFDRKGNLLPHFPIYGAGPVTINSDRKGNVFLATTSEENNVVVYQIPQ